MSIAFLRCRALPVLVVFLGLVGTAVAGQKGLPFQATLVWGTNDPKPEGSDLKPVPEAVARKLGNLPFKWKYYYAVECKEFSVKEGGHAKVRMSDDCEIRVRAVDKEKVELSLVGKGQPVCTVAQKLPPGHMLVTGGNCENMTAWFVVLRRND